MKSVRLSLAKPILMVGAVGASVALLGSVIPWRTGQSAGTKELMAAVVVCMFSFLLGIVVAHRREEKAAKDMLPRVLSAMVLRFGATVTLSVLAAMKYDLHLGAFFVWVAVAYLLLLPFDTAMAVRSFRGDVG